MVENRHLRRLHLRRRRNPPARARRSPLLLLLPLLALAMQLFVVQTHVHAFDFAGQAIRTAISSAPNGSTAPTGFPGKDDQANCPLCQAFAHAGGFLHATQVSTLVPAFEQNDSLNLDSASAPDLHVSHSWFGRGPPSHPVAL